jgi:DNA-binding XRE family transcriptional regulator
MNMAWKEMDLDAVAKKWGIDRAEVREKQKLARLIEKVRKAKRLTQTALAKKAGVSQGRIAQIESGIGTANVSFDVLLKMLSAMGCDYKIVLRPAA